MTTDQLFNEQDAINPAHYTTHKSGIECIEISEHLSACLSQAFQYVWRCGQKDKAVQELEKALWFIEREMNILPGLVVYNYPAWETVNRKMYRVLAHETNRNRINALNCVAMANFKQPEQRMNYLRNARTAINAMIENYK